MRVFALSDIHVDFPENREWIDTLPRDAYRSDALILAGDASHALGLLREALQKLTARFHEVFFVPGNHELWLRDEIYDDSLEKFHAVLNLCDEIGVRTTPTCIGAGKNRVWVVPLFSWYTRPGEGADSLYRSKTGSDDSMLMWADNYFVRWPRLGGHTPVTLFLGMNEDRLPRRDEVERISFSHFLPRQDLIFDTSDDERESVPARQSSTTFNFSGVAGSSLIDEQIRRLGARVHVYGHQHRNRRRYCDGVWYVSNCLGYREERAVAGAANLAKVWPLANDLPAETISV